MVHSVDSSQKAIDLCNKNIALNFGSIENHASFATDAFDFLENMDTDYDVIVLDPPAFAKHLHLREKGLKGYRNINNKVIHKIKKDFYILLQWNYHLDHNLKWYQSKHLVFKR